MEIKSELKENVLIVAPVEKRLDARVASEFKQNLINLIQQSNKRILIDLHAVDFVDSSGLSAMISGLKMLGKNGAMKIASPQGQVKHMFELTRLNLIFEIYDNEQDGLNSFLS